MRLHFLSDFFEAVSVVAGQSQGNKLMTEFIIVTSSQSFPTNDRLVKLFNISVSKSSERVQMRVSHSHISSMVLTSSAFAKFYRQSLCIRVCTQAKGHSVTAVPINIAINQHLSISSGSPLTIFTIK